MGNQHSAAYAFKQRKNVDWKSAGRLPAPGQPEVELATEGSAVALRWAPVSDSSASLFGYRVECRRADGGEWLRTAPPLVQRPELVLVGLPPQRYEFRVAALNAEGVSNYSPVSSPVTVGATGPQVPHFTQPLHDVYAIEGDSAEFSVTFDGVPPPNVAWFKDNYEIFSSRRTVITTGNGASVLVFHQTLTSDEGEVRCTVTNRAGHAVSRARLTLEAPPRLRYPRQYEDGLLYEVNETIYLKTMVIGRPTPTIEWRHNGNIFTTDARVQLLFTGAVASLKILSAQRSDRGEYQVRATNRIGEDAAAFLVTVTAPPEPPRQLKVVRQLEQSVTLHWQPPADDGGCRVGNYVVEYFRDGWDVWLKATTTRQPSATLSDLIVGSVYQFRVKAENPFGMSAPSKESSAVRVGGAPNSADAPCLETSITADLCCDTGPRPDAEPHATSNEFLLVLCPSSNGNRRASVCGTVENVDDAEFRESILQGEEPPPLSLSAPELSARKFAPRPQRLAASDTDLLHEQAMLRMYHAVAQHEQNARSDLRQSIPLQRETSFLDESNTSFLPTSHASFDEDYTASTVSSEYTNKEPSLQHMDTVSETFPSTTDTTSIPADISPRALFVPKPILKRHEPNLATVGPTPMSPAQPIKNHKHDLNSISKKLKNSPHEPFPFPKILNENQTSKSMMSDIHTVEKDAPKTTKIKKQLEKQISDEAIIDHYEDIVKQYGSQNRSPTPQYLNTRELKNAAEEHIKLTPKDTKLKTHTRDTEQGRGNSKEQRGQQTRHGVGREIKTACSSSSGGVQKREASASGALALRPDSPESLAAITAASEELQPESHASLGSPIDYADLEQRAIVSVRTAIDCTVYMCLLLLAFYLYLFRDERLALGPLMLLASRQLRAISHRAPYWLWAPAKTAHLS